MIPTGDAGDIRAFVRRHTSLPADTVEALGAGMGSVAWRVDDGGGEAMTAAYRFLDGVPLSLGALAALSDSARAAGAQLRPYSGFGHPGRELHHRHGARLGSEAVARVEALWRANETESRDEDAAPDVLAHADLKPGLRAHLDALA